MGDVDLGKGLDADREVDRAVRVRHEIAHAGLSIDLHTDKGPGAHQGPPGQDRVDKLGLVGPARIVRGGGIVGPRLARMVHAVNVARPHGGDGVAEVVKAHPVVEVPVPARNGEGTSVAVHVLDGVEVPAPELGPGLEAEVRGIFEAGLAGEPVVLYVPHVARVVEHDDPGPALPARGIDLGDV